ncbi:hypothetical protein L7F22_022350 [Adiantum nelumboides]|nr:hypothetical protein [Adiantum nelumboides]
MYPKHWSDHAAVVTILAEQPVLPPHFKPAISASKMQKFITDTRQWRLTSLFSPSLSREARQEKPMIADEEHTIVVNEEFVKLDILCKKRDGIPSLAKGPATKTQKLDVKSTTSRTSPKFKKDQRSLMSYLQKGDGQSSTIFMLVS